MAALTTQDITERELLKEKQKAIRKIAESARLERAFEEAGCSCHPARGEVAKLQEELTDEALAKHYRAQLLELPEDHELWATIGRGSMNESTHLYFPFRTLSLKPHPVLSHINELEEEIKRIDRKEHPELDAAARAASPWFTVWMMQHPEEISHPAQTIAEHFAHAWVNEGWRPS